MARCSLPPPAQAGGRLLAWRLTEENFDFVCHYGDYIYEAGYHVADGQPVARAMRRIFRRVTLIDPAALPLYKLDTDLQAAHASCPFLSSFDDHEVLNNWAGDRDPKDTPPEDFLFRRAAAFQAWYEHMPVRRSMVPRGPDMLAYRNFQIGKLANIAVLDAPVSLEAALRRRHQGRLRGSRQAGPHHAGRAARALAR